MSIQINSPHIYNKQQNHSIVNNVAAALPLLPHRRSDTAENALYLLVEQTKLIQMLCYDEDN